MRKCIGRECDHDLGYFPTRGDSGAPEDPVPLETLRTGLRRRKERDWHRNLIRFQRVALWLAF